MNSGALHAHYLGVCYSAAAQQQGLAPQGGAGAVAVRAGGGMMSGVWCEQAMSASICTEIRISRQVDSCRVK